MTSSPMLLAIIALLFVGGGVLIGLALGRGSQKLAARCQDLEKELDDARAEFETYQGQVGQHFDQTGELLRAMTLQYRAVYEHLADGARSLCPDQVTSLAAGGAEALLGSGGVAASAAEPPPEAAVEADLAVETGEAEAPLDRNASAPAGATSH